MVQKTRIFKANIIHIHLSKLKISVLFNAKLFQILYF